MGWAHYIVIGLGAYAGIGLLFAVWFVFTGVGRLDPAAKDGPWGFRLLILPGTAALWPLLVRKLVSNHNAAGSEA